MKFLSQYIEDIINQELSSINYKIKSTGFLEILKCNLIDRIIDNSHQLSFNAKEDYKKEFNYEDDYKKVITKLMYINDSIKETKKTLTNNLLIICLNSNIKIGIENIDNKKKVEFILIPKTGISIPTNSILDKNYKKDTVLIEIYHQDKLLDIEKSEENTI